MKDPQKKLAKWNVATALLNKGSLFVHLDPRIKDVVVPPWLRHQPQLVLQVGWDMPVSIPDFRVDEFGIFGTLSFSRTPFACNMPWDSVFALVGDEGKGMVWDDSMPPEIVAEVEREARKATAKPQGHLITDPLKAIKPALAPAKKAKPSKRKLPPYLRVVK
jgi:hypothetical protein